jgi:hypothetical protein
MAVRPAEPINIPRRKTSSTDSTPRFRLRNSIAIKGNVIGANIVEETISASIMVLSSFRNFPIAAAPIKGEEPAVITMAIRMPLLMGRFDAIHHISIGHIKSSQTISDINLIRFFRKFKKEL